MSQNKDGCKKEKEKDNDNIIKATKKYRRLKTIISKVSNLAKMSNIKLNVLVYDPRFHKLKEIYTD